MKTKKSLCFFVAVLVALFAISLVAAELNVTISDVQIDGTSVSDVDSIAASPGDTISVKVKFISSEDLNDVKLSVYIDGYKSEVYASTPRFNVLADKTYTKTLTVKLPSVYDMDNSEYSDLEETLTLTVRLADKDDDIEATRQITLQKESYVFDLLSVDAPLEALAGDIIALDVVLTNEGTDKLDNSFVTAVIPELGVQKKAYFGDIYPEDYALFEDGHSDARERRIYLSIPSNTPTGVYQIEVSASNYDASETVKKNIVITGLAISNNSTSIETENEDNGGIPNSIIILTVILVVIFVVLLVVLIILLTKKPSEKINDFGETSYY